MRPVYAFFDERTIYSGASSASFANRDTRGVVLTRLLFSSVLLARKLLVRKFASGIVHGKSQWNSPSIRHWTLQDLGCLLDGSMKQSWYRSKCQCRKSEEDRSSACTEHGHPCTDRLHGRRHDRTACVCPNPGVWTTQTSKNAVGSLP